MYKASTQKINKETEDLNKTVDKINLTDIYKTLHITATEYMFSSSTQGTFSRIDDILGHKLVLLNLRKAQKENCYWFLVSLL